MVGRRPLLALVLLAAALHGVGIARTLLPAQDGLKFLRTARQFQAGSWTDVVRNSDQHPLYPALIALAEPVVASVLGHTPDAWRIAAQGVAALAAIALILPLHGLTRALFVDERIALLASLFYVLLPLPSAIGHDTLSDSLALLGTLSALRFGEVALRTGDWKAGMACGVSAGLGYLARPEVALVPAAVLLTGGIVRCWGWSVGVHLLSPGSHPEISPPCKGGVGGGRTPHASSHPTPPTPPLQGGEESPETTLRTRPPTKRGARPTPRTFTPPNPPFARGGGLGVVRKWEGARRWRC